MNNREAHFYLEELQRMMTQHRGIFSEEFVCANGMAILSLERNIAAEKKGKWIDTGEEEEWYAREYRCSECGDTMLGMANFCPNCGAEMQEGEEKEI